MFLFKLVLLCVSIATSFSCTEKSEAERLRRFYSSVNADEVATGGSGNSAGGGTTPVAPPTPGISPSGATAQIVQGTPRMTKDGFCGDGIINGTTEDCDQGAIQNTDCRDYGAIGGIVTCQPNCLYNISRCMTPAADELIGGLAETCQCNCETTPCSGGCRSPLANGPSACRFDCDNQCICQCEGRINATIDECKIGCICTVDVNGFPDCTCTVEECEIITAISRNIGTLVIQNSILPIIAH